MHKFLSFAVLSAVLLGCSSNQLYQTAILAPAMTAVSPEIECTVDVVKDVTLSGSATETLVLGIFKSGPSVFAIPQGAGLNYPAGTAGIVAAAWHEALKDTDYDIVINPKVRIEKKRGLLFKRQTATVVGYPGKIEFK